MHQWHDYQLHSNIAIVRISTWRLSVSSEEVMMADVSQLDADPMTAFVAVAGPVGR